MFKWQVGSLKLTKNQKKIPEPSVNTWGIWLISKVHKDLKNEPHFLDHNNKIFQTHAGIGF